MLGIPTAVEELDVSHPWLSQCREKRISPDIRAKCKLRDALEEIGISTSNAINWIDRAGNLPNFETLNSKLLSLVIFVNINYDITINSEDGTISNPNFFQDQLMFNTETGKIVSVFKGKVTDAKLVEYKMSLYRYLRLWNKFLS